MKRQLFGLALCLILALTSGCSLFATTPNKQDKPKSQTQHKQPPHKPIGELVEYKGKVEHIFFHPLIAYPKRAFRGDAQSEQFDMWFNTVPEFNRIIESLYKRDFILVHIHDAFEEVEQNGKKKIKRKKMMLPKGKKPIIISIDDLNYYRSDQIKYGTNEKLVLDKNGEVATLSKDDSGKEVIRRDNEIVPILDDFVKKHPDFSYNGAKGTINLTGFDGVLGYRSNSKRYSEQTQEYSIDNPDYLKEAEAAKPIVQQLKKSGWIFAAHTYYHWPHDRITMKRLKKDREIFKKEVESIIGKTDIYVFPQGLTFKNNKLNGPYLKYLYNEGFRYFQPVGSDSYLDHKGKVIFQDRRHPDGLALRLQAKYFRDLFDADEIFDKENRPSKVKYIEEFKKDNKKKKEKSYGN